MGIMMVSYKILLALIIGFASTSANAAYVYWEPTDGNVNYTYTLDTGYSLAMFDVDDFLDDQSDPLMLDAINGSGDGADTVGITGPSGGNFTALSTVTANSITLFNDDQFVIAITGGTNWFGVNSWDTVVAGSIYKAHFDNGTVMTIDAVPTLGPIPAAVWLFGSGLLGLVGVARRKYK